MLNHSWSQSWYWPKDFNNISVSCAGRQWWCCICVNVINLFILFNSYNVLIISFWYALNSVIAQMTCSKCTIIFGVGGRILKPFVYMNKSSKSQFLCILFCFVSRLIYKMLAFFHSVIIHLGNWAQKQEAKDRYSLLNLCRVLQGGIPFSSHSSTGADPFNCVLSLSVTICFSY